MCKLKANDFMIKRNPPYNSPIYQNKVQYSWQLKHTTQAVSHGCTAMLKYFTKSLLPCLILIFTTIVTMFLRVIEVSGGG